MRDLGKKCQNKEMTHEKQACGFVPKIERHAQKQLGIHVSFNKSPHAAKGNGNACCRKQDFVKRTVFQLAKKGLKQHFPVHAYVYGHEDVAPIGTYAMNLP